MQTSKSSNRQPSPTKGLQRQPKRLTRPAVQLRKLLRRKSGASLAEVETAFGWQPHTARAAISGLRRSGETIERMIGKSGSVYRIVDPNSDQ
ncbi:MAG: DUF3489 domain-containing protein [Pseudomonadota bacterium]